MPRFTQDQWMHGEGYIAELTVQGVTQSTSAVGPQSTPYWDQQVRDVSLELDIL